MTIGSPAIFVDVANHLQPLADEILGEGYEVGYFDNPSYCDPNFCHGESQWTTHFDVGPHTSGAEEDLTSFEIFKERCVGALKHRPDEPIVDVAGLLSYAFNLGKVPAGTYVVHCWW